MDLGAALDAWRERCDARIDPVRFRFIEAMARRAAGHRGEVRRLLDDRLRELLAAYGKEIEECRSTQVLPAAAMQDSPAVGPLAQLIEDIARHASADGLETAASDGVDGLPAAPGELKTLSYFRRTWSRLSADRRLTQSLAAVPENAGPLNSHQLVHRALTLMRELSPEYLHRFMSHVDALLWLDRANAAGGVPGMQTARAEGPKKSSRRRSV